MTTPVPSVKDFSCNSLWGDIDHEKAPTAAATYWLRRDIVRGVFQPGERLKIERLVNFYNIGHSPIREAILVQTASGLVTHEHHKGHRVAPVSLDDYDDVMNTHRRIYRLALEMALGKGGDEWEENIVLQLYRSQKVVKTLPDGDPEARERWQIAYSMFHYKVLEGCGSPILLKILFDLGSRLERYVNLFADLESDRNRDTHKEHRDIVDAIVTRDFERLHKLFKDYYDRTDAIRVSIKKALGTMAA